MDKVNQMATPMNKVNQMANPMRTAKILVASNRMLDLLRLGAQRGVTFDIQLVGNDLLVRERYTRRATQARAVVFADMVRSLTHAADLYCTHLHVVTKNPDAWRPHGFRINMRAATSDDTDLMQYCVKYSRLLTRSHHGTS